MLLQAYEAATSFAGTERDEERLLKPLIAFEAIVRDELGDFSQHKQSIAIQEVFGKASGEIPSNTQAFLGVAISFYDSLKNAKTSVELLAMLKDSGASVEHSDRVFVRTGDGRLSTAKSEEPESFEVRTQPRVAKLIEHLRNDGIKGQKIYIDDLVITQGEVDPSMMRKHPYIIVQIPRMDLEIAVCEQIGEITFVKRGAVGQEFWEHMNKDRLKEREDVSSVVFRSEEKWWEGLTMALEDRAVPGKKVNTEKWRNKAPKLDIDLVKDCLLAHYEATGQWLAVSHKSQGGKKGSYVLEHGPYAGKMTVDVLESALRRGLRSLPGGSTISVLNAEVSAEHDLNYVNKHDQEDLDLELIKSSLLAHYQATGQWLAATHKSQGGKRDSYVLEHGPYAGKMTVRALNSALNIGLRGLLGGSSIPVLNAEVSAEHDLNYVNIFDQEDLDLGLIKSSLLAHYQATGQWLADGHKAEGGKRGSYVLEHGPYAGKMTVGALKHALRSGSRGLPGGSSIALLKRELSAEMKTMTNTPQPPSV